MVWRKKKLLRISLALETFWHTDSTSVYEHLQNLKIWIQILSHRLSSVFPKLLFGHPDDYAHLNCLRFNWLKSLQNHQKFAAGTNFYRHICHFQTLQRNIFFTCMHITFFFFSSFKFLPNNIINNINISFYLGFLNGPVEIFNSDAINNPVESWLNVLIHK